MAVTIKSEREIQLMREAGEILAKTHEELEKALHAGMSTYEVNKIGDEIIRSYGCVPSFLNYNGYPASICVSVNEEVVHGIPSKKRILKDGCRRYLEGISFRCCQNPYNRRRKRRGKGTCKSNKRMLF